MFIYLSKVGYIINHTFPIQSSKPPSNEILFLKDSLCCCFALKWISYFKNFLSVVFFLTYFSLFLQGQENKFPPLVRSAFLQVVFDRANLSDHSVDDSDVSLWLRTRLRPLLVNLSPLHVAPFFAILAGRNCSIGQQG